MINNENQKKSILLPIIFFAIIYCMNAGIAFAGEPEYQSGRLIVKFKAAPKKRGNSFNEKDTGFASIDKLNKRHKVSGMKKFHHERSISGKRRNAPGNQKTPDISNIHILDLPQGADINKIAEEYKKDENVLFAEPDYVVSCQMVPNDFYYSRAGSWGQPCDDLWGLKIIGAPYAWDISQGSGVVVAVVDTGLDYNHEDIAANVYKNPREIAGNNNDNDGNGYDNDVSGWNFVGNNNDPMDDYGHGTHCAGIIAAAGNNSSGVIGVAPLAKIMPLKGLDKTGHGLLSNLAACITYAGDNGADVINISWGGVTSSSLVSDAIKYAYSKGCVIVVATGNLNADVQTFFPANMQEVITVAATDHNDNKPDFSNYGDKIDVAAPGGDSIDSAGFENILSIRANNTDFYGNGQRIVGTKYYRARGTSMSAPFVSGLAALILSKHPEFTNEQVRQVIRQSADDVGAPGFDKYSGYGRINAYRALNPATGAELALNVSRVYPGTVSQGSTDEITVNGSGFRSGDSISFSGTGIRVLSSVVRSPACLEAVVKVSHDSTLSRRDIVFSNTGKETLRMENALEVQTAKNQINVEVSTGAGANFSLHPSFGEIDIEIPADTFSDFVNLTVSTLAVSAQDYVGLTSSNLGFEIKNDKQLQPGKDLKISMACSGSSISGSDRTKLRIARYDEANRRFILLPSDSDAVCSKVSCVINHFSKYALVQLSPPKDLENVKIYPNPFRHTNSAHGVTIAGLTAKAEIKFYTISGELVRTLADDDADGIVVWDTKNDYGNDAASGIYVAVIKGSSCSKNLVVAIER